MLLHDYLSRYNRSHDIQPSTLEHYKWVVRSLESCHGCVDLTALDADTVNGWLLWLRERGRSPWTIKQRKVSLLVLWRAAWFDGLAPPVPPVRRLKPCRHAPEAWTLAEVRQLLAAAAADSRRPLFWCSLIRAGYDSGLRLGNLLALPAAWFATKRVAMPQNVWQVTQLKTGRNVSVGFRPATLDAIGVHLAGRTTGLVWPLWARREAFYRAFRHLVASAQIRPGTFRWLRRTAATQLERVAPGRATELLGHASRSTTEQFYLDRSQLHETPLPPW